MKHTVLCRLATLLAAAWTIAVPLHAVAAQEGPGSPGTLINPNPNPNPPAAAPAETPATRPKRDTYPFRGTVGSVDPAAMTLVLEGKQTKRVVQLTGQTRFEKDGSPAGVEAIKAGDLVGGTLRKTPEGREEALLVRIGPKSDDPSASGNESNRPKRKRKSDTPG